MKKTLNRGPFKGEIVISMNYKTTTKTVHNPSTHDDDKRTFSLHKVETFVNGSPWEAIREIIDEGTLEKEAARLEEKLLAELNRMNTNDQVKNFNQRMQEKGFTI